MILIVILRATTCQSSKTPLEKMRNVHICALARDGWGINMKTIEELAVDLLGSRLNKHDMDVVLAVLKIARIQTEADTLRQLVDKRKERMKS